MAKTKQVAEFGDFQTPPGLAQQVAALLGRIGIEPDLIVEPTCGRGAFLVAANNVFPGVELIGLDINAGYLSEAQASLTGAKAQLIHESFFDHDWRALLTRRHESILIIGNPPWVTNSELGILGSSNLPVKSNFQKHKGFDAVTGKANFDISEWMLLENIRWLEGRKGTIAVLCKTAVARKVLRAAWKAKEAVGEARIYKIDALTHFGAAVDACLFVMRFDGSISSNCAVFSALDEAVPSKTFGYCDGHIVSDVEAYERWRHLRGPDEKHQWRSGVKHDCSKVMEFTQAADGLRNGYGERVDLEDQYLFPLLKSSDIAGVKQRNRELRVLVTQKAIGENTEQIRETAPKTWAYLIAHSDALNARTSVIYKGKPPFSIFGVGPYAFAPWKIAISGLYKRFGFKLFGPSNGKPIMFDDTAYFLPFDNEHAARAVLAGLQTEPALAFLESQVHWDDKRPITVDLLKRLDISKVVESENAQPLQRRLFA